MRKLAATILLLITVFSGACLETQSPSKTIQPTGLGTAEGMIRYLQRANLPPLKKVELWENQYGPGLKLTTAHYAVYTTLLDPLMLSQVPGFVESAYRGYNKQLPQFIETTQPLIIYLFANRAQWDAFTEKFTGPQAYLYKKITKGAYYLKGACVVYNIGRERTFSVLGHEGWHQFSRRHFRFRLPSWLEEGIAMLFETSKDKGGLFYFEPERNLDKLGALKLTLAQNNQIPLKELIALNPGEVLVAEHHNEAVAAFYSQSYALVRFLREDNYGKRLGNYQAMLIDGLEGKWPLSDLGKRIAADRNIPLTFQWNRMVGQLLFRHYIGEDFEMLQNEYMAFCRKIVYHVYLK